MLQVSIQFIPGGQAESDNSKTPILDPGKSINCVKLTQSKLCPISKYTTVTFYIRCPFAEFPLLDDGSILCSEQVACCFSVSCQSSRAICRRSRCDMALLTLGWMALVKSQLCLISSCSMFGQPSGIWTTESGNTQQTNTTSFNNCITRADAACATRKMLPQTHS